MSLVLNKGTSGLPVMTAVSLLGLTLGALSKARAQADIPHEVRAALQKNAAALTRLTIVWERKCSSTLPLPDLLERIKTPDDRAFVESSQTRYTAQGHMFHAFFTFKNRDPRLGLSEHHSEVAFDRKNFYVGNGLVDLGKSFPSTMLQVTPLERLLKEQPNRPLWNLEYFGEAGFQLPATPAGLLQPPESRVLALLKEGARVKMVSEQQVNDEGPCMVIQLTTPDRTYRFDLDPALAFAVRRQEERSGSARRAVVITNSDFVQLRDPEVWLPRRCRAEWHTWPTIADQFSKTPLIVVDFAVSELSQDAVPNEKFRLDYNSVPAALIADGRLPGADQAPDGEIRYFVPVDPAVLDEGVRMALEKRRFVPAGQRSSVFWIAMGLTIGAALTAVGMLSSRQIDRPAPPRAVSQFQFRVARPEHDAKGV